MSAVKLQANDYPISKIFSNDFIFTIPLYQRPYAWTTEQAGELLEDLVTALGDSDNKIDDINPYFLGNIVLIKGDKPDAQVVDGQQRLTTLTVLLAALRASVSKENIHILTKYLYQEDDFDPNDNVYRLTVRERDAQFFKEYIQDEGGIDKLKNLHAAKLSDSRKNFKENTLLFVNRLQSFTNNQLLRLTQFIIKRCFLVVVATPDIDSAYRIFSVINNRGMDLSHADILKAEIIGKISLEQQEKYSTKWEEMEEKLGRDIFKSLFSHIRMIHVRSKPRESILKEFLNDIKPINEPQQLIDKILIPYAEAFYEINNLAYHSDILGEEVNQKFRWLHLIDNSDWIPPAILYLSRHYSNPELLLRFFTDLDRLASGLMIQRNNINERIERYGKLLYAIEIGEDLYVPDSPLQLKPEEQAHIIKILNDDLYLIRKIRLYVLLRLDAALSEGKASYNFCNISVEHVLPQNPTSDSMWVQSFPSQEERDKYVHRMGNLVLLSSSKNAQAQNYDFDLKKQKYFTTKSGICNFALTTQVLMEKEWTPEVINKRQQQLIHQLKEVWRLQ
ncbi:DUF262 domain-containing protein [Nostoc sp. ATCC 53789]|uniref:DUF262 domain-containing protein n=1 Tax=Nostoc sp. ATCC 53789 TaxID=76335 RepID=UPI000DEC0E93|nr:DUF262 domain-containing protein [Nostoc sp. ATCC 53789]QHG14663.1 DUF262 domain-containing protein [Nostoc sp. ATCC 53789]RCJ35858.1 hypothetical protein A6V25_00640 [Nostoc sp. ATCC 53789]